MMQSHYDRCSIRKQQIVNYLWEYVVGPLTKDEEECELFSQTEMSGNQGDTFTGNFISDIDWANGTAHLTKTGHWRVTQAI